MSESANSLQADYMQVLVAQLRYQNPLEPLDNNEMTSQLAMFAQLEKLETLNTSFSGVLDNVQASYAASLVGKDISFLGEAEDGNVDILQGRVEKTYKSTTDDSLYLVIGEYALGLEDVISVNAASPTENESETTTESE
ncbi:MAG: hypothetical protein KAI59_05305 [Planctomycetes bacterium]|nr:hypothetical protein [Planctomycetota bacterium]MCK5473429.1 hypothetical protein [Planctomycetota bacterium]